MLSQNGWYLLQHVAELGRDAHGQKDGHARADADDLDVGDGPQAAEDHVHQLGGQHHRVAAGEQHVADLRRALDVVDLGVELGPAEGLRRVADDAAAGAVAAVAGALGGDEHQHPVGVAVDEAGHGGVLVLGQAVFHHRLEGHHLAVGGDDLLADGAVGVVGVDEAGEVGGDVDAETAPWPLRARLRSESVRLMTRASSSAELRRLDICQRQSIHFSSGTSAQ
jgi:hypothetical protein